MFEPSRSEAGGGGVNAHSINGALILWCGGAEKGERRGAERQVYEPRAATGLHIIVPLGRGFANQSDLAVVETEPFVEGACARLASAVIGKEDARRAGLKNGGGDCAGFDIGQFLGGEHNGDVPFAQSLQPDLDLIGEGAVAQIGPRFIENE